MFLLPHLAAFQFLFIRLLNQKQMCRFRVILGMNGFLSYLQHIFMFFVFFFKLSYNVLNKYIIIYIYNVQYIFWVVTIGSTKNSAHYSNECVTYRLNDKQWLESSYKMRNYTLQLGCLHKLATQLSGRLSFRRNRILCLSNLFPSPEI